MNKDRDKQKEKEEFEDTREEIKEFGIPLSSEFKSDIQFISIIGEIEGHSISNSNKKATKYEHIIPLLLNSHINPEIRGVFIILNTIGGDVEAGLALSEMISSIDKPTVSLVLGGGHSIGVPLAVSTDYSFIAPTATMTIHPIRMTGLVIGVPQTYRYFQKMQERINNFVISNSQITNEDFSKLMFDTDKLANDIGTILVGDEAVSYGLIDEVGGLNKSLDKLKQLMEEK